MPEATQAIPQKPFLYNACPLLLPDQAQIPYFHQQVFFNEHYISELGCALLRINLS